MDSISYGRTPTATSAVSTLSGHGCTSAVVLPLPDQHSQANGAEEQSPFSRRHVTRRAAGGCASRSWSPGSRSMVGAGGSCVRPVPPPLSEATSLQQLAPGSAFQASPGGPMTNSAAPGGDDSYEPSSPQAAQLRRAKRMGGSAPDIHRARPSSGTPPSSRMGSLGAAEEGEPSSPQAAQLRRIKRATASGEPRSSSVGAAEEPLPGDEFLPPPTTFDSHSAPSTAEPLPGDEFLPPPSTFDSHSAPSAAVTNTVTQQLIGVPGGAGRQTPRGGGMGQAEVDRLSASAHDSGASQPAAESSNGYPADEDSSPQASQLRRQRRQATGSPAAHPGWEHISMEAQSQRRGEEPQPQRRGEDGLGQHELDAIGFSQSPTAAELGKEPWRANEEPSSPQARDLLATKRGHATNVGQRGTHDAAQEAARRGARSPTGDSLFMYSEDGSRSCSPAHTAYSAISTSPSVHSAAGGGCYHGMMPTGHIGNCMTGLADAAHGTENEIYSPLASQLRRAKAMRAKGMFGGDVHEAAHAPVDSRSAPVPTGMTNPTTGANSYIQGIDQRHLDAMCTPAPGEMSPDSHCSPGYHGPEHFDGPPPLQASALVRVGRGASPSPDFGTIADVSMPPITAWNAAMTNPSVGGRQAGLSQQQLDAVVQGHSGADIVSHRPSAGGATGGGDGGGLGQAMLDSLSQYCIERSAPEHGMPMADQPSSPQAALLRRARRATPTRERIQEEEPFSPQAAQILRAKRQHHQQHHSQRYAGDTGRRPAAPWEMVRSQTHTDSPREALTQEELDAITRSISEPPSGNEPWLPDQPSSPQAQQLLRAKRQGHAFGANSQAVVPRSGHGGSSGVPQDRAPVGWEVSRSWQEQEPGDSSPQARHLLRLKRNGKSGSSSALNESSTIAALGGDQQRAHKPNGCVSYHMDQQGLSQAELNMLSQVSAGAYGAPSMGWSLGQSEQDGDDLHSPVAAQLRHAKKASRYLQGPGVGPCGV